MRVHHRVYRWAQAHPGRVDALVAASLLVILAGPYTLRPIRWTEVVLSVLVIVPLAVRRTRPVISGAFVATGCLIGVLFSSQPVIGQSLALMTVYSLAAYAPRWASLSGLALALFGGLLFVVRFFVIPMANQYLFAGSAGLKIPVQVIGAAAIGAAVIAAWTLGDLTRARRLTFQALQDKAHRLEIERQHERDLAAFDERSRIAREMHDIVAHSLSVIITQADGARYAAAHDPGLAPAALKTIAETGRASLRDMRRLLGVLRNDGQASTRPLPTLEDVPGLIDTVRRAGLDVAWSAKGSPHRHLPAGAELTAYRVIQESLTNVLKHAGPRATARVLLAWTPQGLEIEVDDDGRGSAADPSEAAGQGLRGMAERVSLYDGRLEAAPLGGGGFRVRAAIPYTDSTYTDLPSTSGQYADSRPAPDRTDTAHPEA